MNRTPQELCTSILVKIKNDIEDKLGKTVNKAVITVPAYFNINQREATLASADAAGFTVLKLLNEPTAAALNYYFKNDCEEENYCLVYDLGGGTFDVAILKRNSTNIDIIAVDGDNQLGGHDFDDLIIAYVCEKLGKDYKFNPKSDRRAMRRLRNKCEEAKIILSLAEETTIVLDKFVANYDTIEIDLTREQFEEMADNLFRRTITILDNCLKSSNVPKNDIKEVILSGGSTRIPKLQKMISSYFDGKRLNKFKNPDECVAKGAALQAAMLSSNPKQTLSEIHITDVIPLSLGISNFVGLMIFTLRRNTPIPSSATSTWFTSINRQTEMSFDIYEGERLDTRKNRHLGKLILSNITEAPPGQYEIFVTMNVDQNGILTVKAKEKLKNNEKDLKIVYTRGNRSDTEVKNAVKDAEDNKEEDKCFKKFALSKEYLLSYCESAIYNFENKNLTKSHKEEYELCQTTKSSGKLINVGDEDKLNNLINVIEGKCKLLAMKYNFDLMPEKPT
ncbi:HSP70 and/or MreB Mbl domain containing protein [Asbolus verrucosus]|uniref:HSP70 and/or MreB Mbl domain containing protein n=1 Tax=Asbolus verrucosus TaxID=1661398 RepID=A0A482VL83_ASBVE|nr:HSP70 and/or MreB Mbl domain containing protein [Asbolus verrucosus]